MNILRSIIGTLATFLLLSCSPSNLDGSKGLFHLKTITKIHSGQVHLSVAVRPEPPFILNYDAPWRMDIDQSEMAFETATLKAENFDRQANQFRVISKPTTQQRGIIHLRFTGFVCTKDKGTCFRKVVSYEIEWPGSSEKTVSR